MRKKKLVQIIFWVFLAGIIVAVSSVYYVFNMPRRNLSKESAAYTLAAKQLIADFKKDENASTAKFLDKAIAVSGEIKSIRTLGNQSQVYSLEDQMEGVSCTVDSTDVIRYASELTRLKVGSRAIFKGRCSGMLMDVQVINCVPQ